MRQNEVARHQKTVADLQKKLADESKKEASKTAEINRIEHSITKSTPLSSLHSKQQQITRAMSALADIQKKKADISKKIADTNSMLHKAQEALIKEEENERKKIYEAEKKREREQLSHQRAITQELHTQYLYNARETKMSTRNVEYDVFISHASEDKEEFVGPLAKALQKAGYKVWFDEFTLKVGDSLRRSIDNGLKNSRFGIVILSNAFFAKIGHNMS